MDKSGSCVLYPTLQPQSKREKKALLIINPDTNKPIDVDGTPKCSKSPETEPVLPIIRPTTDVKREQKIGEVSKTFSAAIKEHSQSGPGPLLQPSAVTPPIAQPTHPFLSNYKTVTQDEPQPVELLQEKTLKEEKSVKVENWEDEQTQEMWRREESFKEDLEDEKKEGEITDSDEGSDEPESRRSCPPLMQQGKMEVAITMYLYTLWCAVASPNIGHFMVVSFVLCKQVVLLVRFEVYWQGFI